MSLWLTVSIWIIYSMWSMIEVHGLYVLHTNRYAYYTRTSRSVTYLWVMFSVFWFCYQIFG